MYWSTTDSIAGHKTIKHGTVLIGYGWCDLLSATTEILFEKAMASAIAKLQKKAENKGYNAIVGLKFQSDNNCAVCVMGTAVLVEQDEQ